MLYPVSTPIINLIVSNFEYIVVLNPESQPLFLLQTPK